MNTTFLITKEDWDTLLASLLKDYTVYAPVAEEGHQDYQPIDEGVIHRIIYNTPKPTTPLKTFFLPVRENVVKTPADTPRKIILGIPSCDLVALDMLDAIYLDEPYVDPYYRQKRENSILIGTDCHSLLEHCHCTTYGVQPYPYKNHDLALSVRNGKVWLTAHSEKGTRLAEELSLSGALPESSEPEFQEVMNRRKEMEARINEVNNRLPDAAMTGSFVRNSEKDIWQKYAASCVACGACATICPTCTCFLLIDRPEFEKVRQMDACQYPAFEKVAAGEDPLGVSHVRFRNRYMCKYVWRPAQFNTTACTGCGRCIEACIGAINKNELFLELYQVTIE
jgi:ferredoxin